MRAIFIGAGTTAVLTAQKLLKDGREVIIIEKDKEKIDSIKANLDCGFICGDGSKPAILREIQPNSDDTLFALTNNDQSNILASLVARSLGTGRTIIKIDDSELEHVCLELGLSDTIIPSRAIAQNLRDKFTHRESIELSTVFRGDARLFTFVVAADQQLSVDELNLPNNCGVICVYRDNQLLIPENDDKLKEDDEVIIIAHEKSLDKLTELYGKKNHQA